MKNTAKSGYNIILNKEYDYTNLQDYSTDITMNRKNRLDYPNYHPDYSDSENPRELTEKRFSNKEFLDFYNFKDQGGPYKAENVMGVDQNIIYKTKEMPNALRAIFSDAKQLKSVVEVVKKLIILKIDFRILSSIKVGFMKEMIQKSKEITSTVPLAEFKKYMSNYHSSLSEEAEELLTSQIMDEEKENVSFVKLTRLVDFYNYYPVTVKRDKNASTQLFEAISSGLQKDEDGTLRIVTLTEEEKRLN